MDGEDEEQVGDDGQTLARTMVLACVACSWQRPRPPCAEENAWAIMQVIGAQLTFSLSLLACFFGPIAFTRVEFGLVLKDQNTWNAQPNSENRTSSAARDPKLRQA